MTEVSLLDILSQPAWQGTGAVIAFIGLVLYVWVEAIRRRRRHSPALPPTSRAHGPAAQVQVWQQEQVVRYLAIVDAESERRYYSELTKHIRGAKEVVYRTGRGFHHEGRASVYGELIKAEEEALNRGVEMIRIQISSRVAASWADGYAKLLDRFPQNFRILADIENVLMNDMSLIDPHGHDPVINFLFENLLPGPLGTTSRPVIALFIENARTLSSTLAQQLVKRAGKLPGLTPQGVRDLARTYTYFCWGVHMASRKMLRDVPDALRLGAAVLPGWQRDIHGLLAGPANRATIQHTGDSRHAFDGVAYELSWWGKARLDRLERRSYEEVMVTIEVNGKARPAFTYVPLPPATAQTRLTPGSWIDLIIEGALENEMTALLAELRSAGAGVDALRSGTL
ncbi:MAG TPA: gamma-glutamylcyclotransferase family protein [Micromonosporaceae bacterium]|nr:gamma-glutamylcyclotransferase family protein [Micromonosporaceae bacterium]